MKEDRRVEKLRIDHAIDVFDCGQADLNQWLRKHALQNIAAGGAQTYLGLFGNDVAGYYSLAVGAVEHAVAPERMKKGVARHPVPVMLLARLAVDTRFQRQGVGYSLLQDAIRRTLAAAEIAGIRALVVHAKDDAAAAYYEQFGFERSVTDRFHLMALLKDMKKLIV
ncbi:MAG: GNAT family N-acetyltransferase [Acidobacteriota bacterium]|nr:GNAT family N-acetyltransferase [Acidobacteriota bacterium]